MAYIESDTLQTDTVIAKATQTIIGNEINCGGYSFLTLFFTYTKGDETGIIIQAHTLHASGGTPHQDCSWTAAAGTKTATINQYTLTATASRYIVFDVRGIQYIKFTQGGSADDGTPTGKLLASYTMTG
jgi:hypothetical protein